MLIIVQARLGSTRLPGKIKLPLHGKKAVLNFLLDRLDRENVIVATPTKDLKQIEKLVANYCDDIFGVDDEDDVLRRYAATARKFASYESFSIVRITSDCPLIDISCLENMEEIFYSGGYDYVSNCHPFRYVPSGFDIEMFSYEALMEANFRAKDPYEREHVTPYIFNNFKAASFQLPKVKEKIDITQKFSIDTKADYEKVKFLVSKLVKRNDDYLDFTMQDVLKAADKYALELAAIEHANKT